MASRRLFSRSFDGLGNFGTRYQVLKGNAAQFRHLLRRRLCATAEAASEGASAVPPPTQEQLKALSLAVAVPMIGFGFADNFIMIIAGDVIGIRSYPAISS